MPEPTFDDKIVVITGAGRGLGFGMARRFGQAGAHVIVAELEVALGEQAAEKLRAEGLKASFEPLDVRIPEQSVQLVEKVVKALGGIDVWVNNAGVAYIGPARALPIEQWDRCTST